VEEIGRSIHFYSVSTMCFGNILFSILNSIQVGGSCRPLSMTTAAGVVGPLKSPGSSTCVAL
jgi:hypothetical protein